MKQLSKILLLSLVMFSMAFVSCQKEEDIDTLLAINEPEMPVEHTNLNKYKEQLEGVNQGFIVKDNMLYFNTPAGAFAVLNKVLPMTRHERIKWETEHNFVSLKTIQEDLLEEAYSDTTTETSIRLADENSDVMELGENGYLQAKYFGNGFPVLGNRDIVYCVGGTYNSFEDTCFKFVDASSQQEALSLFRSNSTAVQVEREVVLIDENLPTQEEYDATHVTSEHKSVNGKDYPAGYGDLPTLVKSTDNRAYEVTQIYERDEYIYRCVFKAKQTVMAVATGCNAWYQHVITMDVDLDRWDDRTWPFSDRWVITGQGVRFNDPQGTYYTGGPQFDPYIRINNRNVNTYRKNCNYYDIVGDLVIWQPYVDELDYYGASVSYDIDMSVAGLQASLQNSTEYNTFRNTGSTGKCSMSIAFGRITRYFHPYNVNVSAGEEDTDGEWLQSQCFLYVVPDESPEPIYIDPLETSIYYKD